MINRGMVGRARSPYSRDAITKAGTFLGFTGAEAKTLNLTGLVRNNPVVRALRLWVSNDPTADENILCRLSFYNSDSMTEDELLWDIYFNLTYSEVKVEISATDTSIDIDDTDGIVANDLVRLLGGTAENVRVSAVTDSDTLAVTACANGHLVDTAAVRVAGFVGLAPLYDADGTNEIHAKLETLSAPTASMNVDMEVDVQ